MSEKFYWKKQRLAHRDKLLESIGRTVFNRDELPQSFGHLPRVFRLKEQLLDQLRDRKGRLRDVRNEAISQLEKLEQEAAVIEQEFEEKLLPFKQKRDRDMLRFQHAEDLAAQKEPRAGQNPEKAMEDLSCKVNALELRIQAGEKHRREKIEEIEKQARPLRERIARQNQMFSKALNEEEHLKMERLGQLIDLGYHYYSKRQEPETFESQYQALDKLIEELADYRTGKSLKEEAPEEEVRENFFWKGLLVAIAIAAVISLLFRTQYREGQMNFATVAAKFLPSDSDDRLYMDLNQVGLESWYDDMPALVSLPGGSFFSGMARKDILGFIISKEALGDNPVRFCGVKLRQSPARAAYRLGQLGWKRQANKSGFQVLTKGDLMWVLLSDREFMLIPRNALDQLESLSKENDNSIFRLEKRITAFEAHQTLLQDLNRLELTLNGEDYQLDLQAEQALPDALLRKKWLEAKLEQNPPGPQIHISFNEDGLRIAGTYDPDQMPFHKDGLKAFVIEQLNPVLQSRPVAKQPNTRQSITMPAPAAVMDLPHLTTHATQGVMLLQHREEGVVPIHQVALGKALTDICFLDETKTALVVDAGNMCIHQLKLVQGQLKLGDTIQLNAKAMNGVFSTGTMPFIPSKIFAAPNEDFALVLEGEGGHRGRRRLLLLDLKSFSPVALEELPFSVKRPLAAAWGPNGHDVFVGTEVFPRVKGGATRVLGYHREGYILALSNVIRANPNEGRGGVFDLLYRSAQSDMFLRHGPSQTLIRYAFSEGAWQMDERVVLEQEPKIPTEGQAMPGNSMEPSRNFLGALLLDRRSQIPAGDSYKLFAVDLDPLQFRVVHTLPLAGKPYSLMRIPLHDRYVVTLPGENGIETVDFIPETGELQEVGEAKLEAFSPHAIASDAFGEFLLVTGFLKDR